MSLRSMTSTKGNAKFTFKASLHPLDFIWIIKWNFFEFTCDLNACVVWPAIELVVVDTHALCARRVALVGSSPCARQTELTDRLRLTNTPRYQPCHHRHHSQRWSSSSTFATTTTTTAATWSRNERGLTIVSQLRTRCSICVARVRSSVTHTKQPLVYITICACHF